MPGIWHQAGCCCFPPRIVLGDECTLCDTDTTPLQYAVTTSGIVLCDCWRREGFPQDFEIADLLPVPNNTWIVTQSESNSCIWTFEGPASGETRRWPHFSDEENCTRDLINFSTITGVEVSVVLSGDVNMHVDLRYLRPLTLDVLVFKADIDLGEATVNCLDGGACSNCNDWGPCDQGAIAQVVTGPNIGSVSVVAI